MGLLTAHVAIVTGAAGGQGEAEARLFHAEGAQVVLADVADDPGQQVADELGDGAFFAHLDVAERSDWSRVLKLAEAAFGPVDVLVNNAAILRHESVLTATEESFLEVLRVNTWGCVLGMQTVAPGMQALGHGSIVNVASSGGIIGQVGVIAYVCSKFGVRGATKAAALELAPGIRVNSLHPGWVDTAMGRNGQDDAEYMARLTPICQSVGPRNRQRLQRQRFSLPPICRRT